MPITQTLTVTFDSSKSGTEEIADSFFLIFTELWAVEVPGREIPVALLDCRVDEVIRHPHPVTQDQFSVVSKRVVGIPEDNFTINTELF
jgi:hypothetical protein